MTTNTFVALKSTTLASPTATITFSDIPATYTDLVLMSNSKCDNTATGASITLRFNSDSAGNYSQTSINASGTSRITERYANTTGIDGGRINTSNSSNLNWGQSITHIQNYASTSYRKMCISKSSVTNEAWKQYLVGSVWRNSSDAIHTITITCGYNFLAGSSFSLYGIKRWSAETTPKATGGYVYEDSTYYYHTFLSSGTFTPNQSLTCDYLVIAGGGGATIGGGGAGGLRSTIGATGGGGSLESALSLSATNYTVTIGAGGAGRATGVTTQGGSGTNSVFSTITSTGGGGGGAGNGAGAWNAGLTGGSGGGGHNNASPGSGTANQGYAGGTNSDGGTGSGGGGAGAVGGNFSGSVGGVGGAGVSIASLATATGTGVANFYAGGGGGFGSGVSVGGSGGGGGGSTLHGVMFTGGGGGANANISPSGNGGSGLVIIRYAK